MSALPQKFTFDLDFAATGAKKQRLIADEELAELLAEAEQRGYERGLSEGEQSELAKTSQQLEKSTQMLVKKSGEALQKVETAQAEIRADAVNLATTTASKLANALVALHPIEQIHHLMDECLSSLDGAPHLVIRCNDVLADQIKEKAEATIATSGFSGRLIIMGEPDIGIGDARFEWADGGLVRDMSAIASEIDQKIEQFLNPTLETPAPETAAPSESGDQIHG